MKPARFQDLIAGLVVVIALVAIIAFALLEKDTPAALSEAFFAGLAWVFRGGVDWANGRLAANNRRPRKEGESPP